MPATTQKPTSVVAHRAWREARTMILAAASGGPRTLALIGAAGTGKTWLLTHLAPELRELGRQVKLERSGRLPSQFPLGAILLVDEASRLDRGALEKMATQQRGLVILADMPALASDLGTLSRPPAMITLPTIDDEEVPSFVAEWMAANDHDAEITDAAIDRLIAHAGGTPRLLVQLVNAALTLDASPTPRIGAAEIDQVAALRLDGLTEAPTLPDTLTLEGPAADDHDLPTHAAPVTPSLVPDLTPYLTPEPVPALAAEPERLYDDLPLIAPDTLPELVALRPRRIRWPLVAALATPTLAACLVVAWVQTHGPAAIADATLRTGSAPRSQPSQPATGAAELDEPPIPAAKPSLAAEPSLPVPDLVTADAPNLAAIPLHPEDPAQPPTPLAATSPRPTVASAPPPTPTDLARAPDRDTLISEPPARSMPAPEPGIAPPPTPELAPPPPATPSTPSVAADLAPGVAQANTNAGAPGLIFIARRGDTLPALYAHIYQGLRPPPYEAVLAANPRPVRPGELIVFPTPPDGWTRP